MSEPTRTVRPLRWLGRKLDASITFALETAAWIVGAYFFLTWAANALNPNIEGWTQQDFTLLVCTAIFFRVVDVKNG